ncbi:T9SS type A sorting domain-containing protein [Winogradskyella litoriviva]|uniref:T9SS type A sorting domain-containing protein n=1 Tax=Winogradskyella litoriviva TaxID=1220182 RepID=A0ABX2E4M0_9FLAO|nr:T9SS type A sorting domain-containing protein [Winogradskyella litoriviva]NRD23328.1 T9SS type A sorting domain-containing protein [Winogradskyella litoriviva]
MKKITLFIFLMALSFGYSQTLPLDFESATTWIDFDGGAVTTIANPQSNADNNSANVGQMVKSAGQVWGGSALVLSSAMDFTTNNTFSMKAYSVKAGTKVLMKVENSGDAGINYEKEVTMTSTNTWETLVFDYSAIPANTYDKIVVIFDLGTMGDGTANFTYYFDDITLYDNGGGAGATASLPLDFEIATTWVDFDGGEVTTIANPQSNADNNSANVGQMIKNAGQVWGGSSLVLSAPMDFTANNTFSMKAYSVKADTKVLMKVENSGDAGINFEKEVTMTTTNAWETLVFDYSSIPANTYDKIVVIFDLGTMGDGTANFTYYFDDVTLFDNGTTGPALALPFDFETEPTTTDFVDFDGGTASVIANPQSVAPNTSANVAQIVRNGGQIWGGSKITIANNLDFSAQGGISMKVFTTAPVGTTVKLKLEGNGQTEIDQLTTVSGAWETLTWDFTGQPADFNTLVFMFDFGNLGDGTANSTFLFDDVEQFDISGGLSQINHPVDFEGTTTNYTVTDFGGNASTLVVDPTDSGNMVIQTIKTSGAATWAGTTISTPTGFATALPFTTTDTKMYVSVWSPDAGIPVRLKVEDHADNTHTCETEAVTTIAGGWETLEFNFNNEAAGTAALNPAYTFDMASIFFNFGTDGATAGEKTYYFDNVSFGTALGLNEFEINDFTVYPNPTNLIWNVKTKNQTISSVQVFDVLGKQVITLKPNKNEVLIDASTLKSGIYFAKLTTANGTQTIKLVKN